MKMSQNIGASRISEDLAKWKNCHTHKILQIKTKYTLAKILGIKINLLYNLRKILSLICQRNINSDFFCSHEIEKNQFIHEKTLLLNSFCIQRILKNEKMYDFIRI